MARARTFHEAVLCLALAPLGPGDPAMLAFPGDMEVIHASGRLVRMDGVPSGGNRTLVYFSCTDCAVEQERVTAAGGVVQRPKMSIGEYGFISLIVDTEGNRVGLHSMA